MLPQRQATAFPCWSSFNHVEIWCPSLDDGYLFCVPDSDTKPFAVESAVYHFPFGAGTPGRVWINQIPEYIENIADVSDSYYLRRENASRAGFRSLLAVPVRSPEACSGFPSCVVVGYTYNGRPMPNLRQATREAQSTFRNHPFVRRHTTTVMLNYQSQLLNTAIRMMHGMNSYAQNTKHQQIRRERTGGQLPCGNIRIMGPQEMLHFQRMNGLQCEGEGTILCRVCALSRFREDSFFGHVCEVCISYACVDCLVSTVSCACPRNHVCAKCVETCQNCHEVCCSECVQCLENGIFMCSDCLSLTHEMTAGESSREE